MEEYKKWGLEMNLDKGHYMCIGQQQSDLLLEEGELIKTKQRMQIFRNAN
jgi:hypothetical protein